MSFGTILAAVAAVLLSVRMVRQREFHINRMWIMPTAVLVVAAFGLSGSAMTPTVLLAIAIGTLAGVALGVLRATASLDHVDVAARRIMTKPSLWFALLFAATFVLKVVVRHGPMSALQEATDFVLCLTAASICAQRLQFYLAFRRAEAG
jgi:hypothetical protein